MAFFLVCNIYSGVHQFWCRWEHLQSLRRNSVFILDKNPRKLGTEGLCLSPCSCALCDSWLIWVSKWYLVLCRFLTPTFVIRRQWQTFWSLISEEVTSLLEVEGSIWLSLGLKTEGGGRSFCLQSSHILLSSNPLLYGRSSCESCSAMRVVLHF